VRRELPEDVWMSPTSPPLSLAATVRICSAINLATGAEAVLRRLVGAGGARKTRDHDYAYEKCLHGIAPKVCGSLELERAVTAEVP
jgi:hypothetical protein